MISLKSFFYVIEDAVEIVGTPQSMNLLSKFVDQFKGGSANSVSTSHPSPSIECEERAPAASTEDVQIIDVHLTSEKYIFTCITFIITSYMET